MFQKRVYVGNLSESVRPSDLYSHFVKCGKILTIQKRHAKFAFVEFEAFQSAGRAISDLNATVVKDHVIKVNRIHSNDGKKSESDGKISNFEATSVETFAINGEIRGNERNCK